MFRFLLLLLIGEFSIHCLAKIVNTGNELEFFSLAKNVRAVVFPCKYGDLTTGPEDSVQQQLQQLKLINENLGLKLDSLIERFERSDRKTKKPSLNCAEAITSGSGLYKIQTKLSNSKPFLVSCDADTQGGGWTVIQRRLDGSVDFFRDWKEYKNGFGNLEGEFWMGLDRLHEMTTQKKYELLIVMEDFFENSKFAKYDEFVIGSESEDYELKTLGTYSGTAGDSLRDHVGKKFSTKDKDNDASEKSHCAKLYDGAWWYNSCYKSNLNGKFLRDSPNKADFGKSISWNTHSYYLKYVQMMIRPKK